MDAAEGLEEVEFEFHGCKLNVLCRKTLSQTINFRTTMQCEVNQLYESLRDFGGGFNSDSDSDALPPTVVAADTEATAKPDLLGLDVWPAALQLCEYLASNPQLVEGRDVLELGAGVGLPGLVAAQLGARSVVLTDYELVVVDHVARNAGLCGVLDRCSGLVLDWTKLCHLPPQHRNAYSVLLAADVLYIQDIMPGFVEAVAALMAPGGVLIVGHQTRRALVLDGTSGTPMTLDRDVSFERFKALCAAAGLQLRQLGSRESPGFPGPLMMLAIAADPAELPQLPLAFQHLAGDATPDDEGVR